MTARIAAPFEPMGGRGHPPPFLAQGRGRGPIHARSVRKGWDSMLPDHGL